MPLISPQHVIFAGVVISAIGAVWNATQDDKFKNTIIEKSKVVESLQSELIAKANESGESQRELKEKSEEIARLNQTIALSQTKLREVSDEITKISTKSLNSITGGGSYVNIRLSMPTAQNELVKILAFHDGDYPVYDATVNIEDDDLSKQNNLKSINGMTDGQIFEALEFGKFNNLREIRSIDLGTSIPGLSPRDLGYISLKGLESKTVITTSIARNGFQTKRFKYQLVKGKWYRAIRFNHNNKISEEVDVGFPRNEQGEVQW